MLSGYFIVGASIVYWVVAAGGAVGAWIVPRALIQRLPLAWLIASTALTVYITQTIPGFFPDLTSPRDIVLQLALVVSLGLVARAYLLYTECADTFDGLNTSMQTAPSSAGLPVCFITPWTLFSRGFGWRTPSSWRR